MSDPVDDAPHGREVHLVFLGLTLGMLLPTLTATIVSTALPAIVGDLGGLSDLSWIVTVYMLTSTVAIPLVGKTSDIYGRKPLYTAAIGVYVGGSVLCGLAQSIGQLVAFRAVQGIGGGSLFALAYAITGDVVPARRRGRYQGYISAVYMASALAGPVIGGLITDRASWRWVFFINVPLGVAAIWLNHRHLNVRHVRRPAQIDYGGAALLTAMLVAVLLVVTWGGHKYAWDSGVMVGLTVLAVGCGLALIPVERRAPAPVVPYTLFRRDVFRIGSGLMLLQGIGLMGPLVFMPTFLQLASGTSAVRSGLVLLPLMASMVTGSVVSGALVARTGRYRVFPILGAICLLAGYVLLGRLDVHTGYTQLALDLVIVGFGVGIGRQVLILVIQNSVTFDDLGVATSASQLFHMLGGTLGLAAFGAVINSNIARWATDIFPGGAPGGVAVDQIASNPDLLRQLPEATRSLLQNGIADAIASGFTYGAVVLAVAVILSVRLREIPLDETTGHQYVA